MTYGVCLDGALVDDAAEYESGDDALRRAEALKREDPEALVTICLWTD